MLEQDKKQFAQVVRSTMLVCGGSAPESDVLRIWWATFEQFDLADISMAFSQYAQRGEYAPKPADILKILDRIKPDGRPTADEAWAMIPRDEMTSAVMTQEMADAWGVARPLLDEGDQVAARMAFKDVYNRNVEESKRNGLPPKWFASLGHDPDGREDALTDAVLRKRITAEFAERLLSPEKADSMRARPGIKQPLLENKTNPEMSKKLKELAATIFNKDG